MALRKYIFFILHLVLIVSGCSSVQHISKTEVRYDLLNSSAVSAPDEEITALIAPYKVEVDKEMNEVLGNVPVDLTKRKPESTLGNWYSDAMIDIAAKKGYNADFAISNYGGLRIPQITAGPLTMGEIFELCPFDNLLVIVEMKGDIVDSLLQQTASSEGWPVSKGIKMIIADKKMVQCTIQGVPLSSTATYKVAMPDYVANGGDGLKVLITQKRVQTAILIRDMLIEYARDATAGGKEITSAIDGRIVIQH
ncbi:MAG: 5'-nucleotidase C-terminal domain-containing protein [Saprospiraceae bacterium]|nr:5'-nucleotidase C-terminal domain-containing protein [Saprospiraceae bacterium]